MILALLLASVNLLVNPSFEDWPDGSELPSGWRTDLYARKGKVSRLTAQGTDGEYAIAIRDGTLSNFIGQAVPVTPGKYYDLSVDVKTDIGMYQFRMMPYWEDAAGKRLPDANRASGCPFAEVKTPWTRLELRNYLAPTNAAALFFCLAPNDCHRWTGVPGVIMLDNACMKESPGVRPDAPVAIAKSGSLEVLRSGLTPGRDRAELLVRSVRAQSLRLVAEEPVEGGKVILSGERTFRLAGGEERSFRLPLATRSPALRFTLFADGRAVWRRQLKGDETSLALGLQDPFDVRKGEIFIPNDARWYVNFPIDHTLRYSKQTPGGDYGNPKELNAKVVIETPEGVSVPYLQYAVDGIDHPVQKPETVERAEWNGKPVTRSRFGGRIAAKNPPLVFFTSTLPAGTETRVRAWMEWNGGAQVPLELRAKIVAYGRVKPFERMELRLDRMWPNLAFALSDDPVRELPTLGVNVLRVPPEPSKDRYSWYHDPDENLGGRLRRLMTAMRESGLGWRFCIPNDIPLEAWANDIHWRDAAKLTADPDARFMRENGQPFKNSEGWIPPCPNYRGTNFLAQAKFFRECEAVKDLGVRWFVCDWEFWENTPCHCERCKRLFKESGMESFEDFYWMSRGRMYADFKKELAKDGLAGFTMSEWTSPRKGLVDGVDTFDWPFGYHSPESKWEIVDRTIEELYADTSRPRGYTCSVCPMQSCETCYRYPPDSVYYSVLEAATAGVKGFEWFYSTKTESMTWKYVMDGLRAIRPFEDIVLDGKIKTGGQGTGCTWRRIAKGNEGLYLVRNYTLASAEKVAFSLRVKRPVEVRDCASGEKLAALEPGENEVRISLGPGNLARLVYVGNRFEERRRMTHVPEDR